MTDAEGDPLTLVVTAIRQDEPVGTGNSAPDGKGIGAAAAELRAEKLGSGDGRVYHVSFTASDGHGGACTGVVRVAILLASLENRGVIELRHWARSQEIAERWRRSLHNLYIEINAEQDEAGQREDRVLEIVRRLGTATPTDIHREARQISTTEAAELLQRLERAGALVSAATTRQGTVAYQIGESCRF